MPSYPDLTQQEVVDLAAYIHFLRQAGRHRELAAAPVGPGDAAAGRTYFTANCETCHSVTTDLKGLATRHDRETLKARLLGPPPPAEDDGGARGAGRRRHLTLLERYRDDDVRVSSPICSSRRGRRLYVGPARVAY